MEDMLMAKWIASIPELHEKVLYPTVLVKTSKSGGSGTAIFSQPHPDGDGYLTFILTNYHVVDDAITFTTDYEPMVGRKVEKPIKEIVYVGFYKYRHLSKQKSVVSHQADIIHWDKSLDLALLQLRERVEAEHVAKLFPETGKHPYMFTPVLAVGCSLGHKPLPSIGIVSSLDEQIENRPKFMSSAQIIYGNSGGALYTLENKELLGIPCAGDVLISGFSAQAIPHLGYVIPYYSIYDFLRDGCLEFIFDESKTYEECMAKREENMDELQKSWEARWRREQALGM